ncbi:hypothetical protein PR001_g6029 [Phytophthora rubi]|uniref:Uncharacterized protein n=1 Tax=Phytophthora rubi TaxID=129364 RepID=A0A6A3MXI1_9STRA|nr:hypothetical protein PR002_g6330 [Phytophthora rubi]KAE9042854.1 hypothetical protein PR001_g6029 [Phytophthora rubi]
MEQSSSDMFFKKLAMAEVACKGLLEAFSRISVSVSSEVKSDEVQLQEWSDSDAITETVVLGEDDELDADVGPQLDSEDEFLELENAINAPYENTCRECCKDVQRAGANDGAYDDNAGDKNNTADHHILHPRRGKGDEAIGDTTSCERETNGDANGGKQRNGDDNGDGDFFDGDDRPLLAEHSTTQSTEAQTVTNASTTLRTELRLSKLVFPRPRYALQLLPDPTPYHESVLWSMQDFYRLKSDHKLHMKAMTWLGRD